MNPTVPFPAVPRQLGERWTGASLRPFGAEPGDLDVDLDGHATVAELLARCAVARDGSGFAAEELRVLRLGARIEGLLRLALLAGTEAIPQLLRCSACDERVELELPLAALADLQREVGELASIEVGEAGAGLRLRLPTIEDLDAWAGAPSLGDRELVERLVVAGGPVTDALLPVIDAALADADPLVDFHVAFRCPMCDAEQRQACDLEALTLDRLAAEQVALLDAIHTLARSYHWDEATILRLPEWRRRAYLERLAREEARE